MKKRIRLTESDLHRIVNRSANRILNEEKVNLKQKRREIYSIVDEIADEYGLDTALSMLEGVRQDIEYYKVQYHNSYIKARDNWQNRHYDQLYTGDGGDY